MTSRTHWILLPILFASLQLGLSQSERHSDSSHRARASFSLTISTPTNVLESGAPIVLHVTKTNTSNHNIYFAAGGGPGRSIKLKVLGSKGNPAQETQHGINVHGTNPNRPPAKGSFFAAPIAPGKSIHRKRFLSKEYNLSKPGKYTVQAHEYDLLNRTMVKSNVLTITITP